MVFCEVSESSAGSLFFIQIRSHIFCSCIGFFIFKFSSFRASHHIFLNFLSGCVGGGVVVGGGGGGSVGDVFFFSIVFLI